MRNLTALLAAAMATILVVPAMAGSEYGHVPDYVPAYDNGAQPAATMAANPTDASIGNGESLTRSSRSSSASPFHSTRTIVVSKKTVVCRRNGGISNLDRRRIFQRIAALQGRMSAIEKSDGNQNWRLNEHGKYIHANEAAIAKLQANSASRTEVAELRDEVARLTNLVTDPPAAPAPVAPGAPATPSAPTTPTPSSTPGDTTPAYGITATPAMYWQTDGPNMMNVGADTTPATKPAPSTSASFKATLAKLPLEGVVISLVADGKFVLLPASSRTTGQNGIVSFAGLKPGVTYQVLVESVPNGVAFPEPRLFVVDGKPIVLELTSTSTLISNVTTNVKAGQLTAEDLKKAIGEAFVNQPRNLGWLTFWTVVVLIALLAGSAIKRRISKSRQSP